MLRDLFLALLSVGIFLAVTFFLRASVKSLIIQEVRRNRQLGRKVTRAYSRWLAWSAVAGVLLSVLLAWFFLKPLFGLLGLFLIPRLLTQVTSFLFLKRANAMDNSGISYLYALQGLLKVGINLPTAFFQLSASMPSAFGDTLNIFLKRFSKGVSLTECLAQFRQSAQLQTVGGCIALLEMAYRNGFPVGQLLDRMIPTIETELQNQQRIRSLRQASLVQACFACLLPWFLGIVLFFFQPDIVHNFLASSAFFPLVLVSLTFEGMGLYFIWKLSNFY